MKLLETLYFLPWSLDQSKWRKKCNFLITDSQYCVCIWNYLHIFYSLYYTYIYIKVFSSCHRMWLCKYTYCFNFRSDFWNVSNLLVCVAWKLVLTKSLYLLSKLFCQRFPRHYNREKLNVYYPITTFISP